MLFLKNLIFSILVPGTVTVVIPYWILSRGPEPLSVPWTTPRLLAFGPAALGLAIYLWCLWDFASFGRGTPAPLDPPKHLVVRGLYRYVRNPMYVGLILILLAEAAFFDSGPLLRYAIGYFIVIHIVVMVIEEPILEHKFGESYENYCREVRRWLPGRRYGGRGSDG